MANLLSVTKSNAINHLHQQGLSQRQIADAVNVDRKTVRRLLAQLPLSAPTADDPKGTTAPTGSEVPTDQLISVTSVSSAAVNAAMSASQCALLAEVIEQKLELGLTAQRIFQDLQIEHNFDGSYWSVRRYVK